MASSRIFILGNGPSLKETPWELLSREETMAVNKIRLIYPHTDWRPDYYVRTDDIYENQDEGWHEDVQENIDAGVYCWLGPMFYEIWGGIGNVAGAMPICGEHIYHAGDREAPERWHASGELCNFGGSLSVAIQIVNRFMKDDVEKIYLLGCDLYPEDGTTSHFDPYYNNAVPRPFPNSVLNADKIAAHEIAKKCSRIPIYNATIGGRLEVYPRVDLLEVLCQGKNG